MNRVACLAMTIAIAVLYPHVAARAAEAAASLDAVLGSARSTDRIPIIATFRQRTSGRELAKSLQSADRRERRRSVAAQLKQAASEAGASIRSLAAARGGEDLRLLWAINGIAMRASPELIRQLLETPEVVQVRLDTQYPAPLPFAAGTAPAQWNIDMIGARELWMRGYRGEGVVLASLDTGVDAAHPDLAPSYRGGEGSWFDPYGEHAGPRDVHGHGTQVMGILVGGEVSGGAIGVAPAARWIAARVFNNAGVGSESAIHLAFQWLLDPDQDPQTDDAPAVVSSSWAISQEGVCDSVFQPDIDALRAADIAVVYSAGNFGPGSGTSVSPANGSDVISVGAVDASGAVAPYSSRGPSACDNGLFPKFVAPGEPIYTTDLSFGGSPYYTSVAGTSFAAPHVAGVLVLLRGAYPQASAAALEAALAATARDLGQPGADQDTGYGVIDALAAFDLLARPIDMDGDGYGVDSDCNDYDAAAYPGAPEIRRDGIDQDCNGYDLTLSVRHAVYSHDGSRLRLEVVSAYGEHAAVELEGVGPLTWRPRRRDWVLTGAAGEPRTRLTLRGLEGRIFARPRMPWPLRERLH